MRSLVEGQDDDEDDVQERADTELDKTRRILPSPADSPGHEVETSGLARQLRDHHSMRTVGSVAVEHVDLQQLGPEPVADLHTAGPDGNGSSIHADPGQARMQSLDQAAASASFPLPGSPSASPKRPDFGPAPSGHGQQFGKTPSRPPQSGF